MKRQDERFIVAPFLRRGAENSTSTDELMRLTGIQGERAIRFAVKHDRMAGALILSNSGRNHGYYLPANRTEAEKFVKSMRSRAISEFANIKCVSQALKRSGFEEYRQLELTDILREVEDAEV